MAHAGKKPTDVLLAELEFLNEYLIEVAQIFRSQGRNEDAEIAEGWSSLPIEAAERISDLINR
jgi:hypothetical protein